MEKDEKWISQERLKKWLKIFVIFLAVMWVCTIISKSIYVAQLPRVQVKTLEKKYIEHVVDVDGIVVAGGEQAVNVLPGLRVSNIKVQEGDLVEKGDLLFGIDLEDLSDMISDKEAELTKQRMHLSDTQFNQILESQKKEIGILWAKEDYESAEKETALTVERAKQTLAEAETDLHKHLGTPIPHTSDKDRENAWFDYNQWKQRGYDLEDQIAAKQRKIEELQEQLQNLEVESAQEGAEKQQKENMQAGGGEKQHTMQEEQDAKFQNMQAGGGEKQQQKIVNLSSSRNRRTAENKKLATNKNFLEYKNLSTDGDLTGDKETTADENLLEDKEFTTDANPSGNNELTTDENPSENNEPTTGENPPENNEPTTDENPSENKEPTTDENPSENKKPTTDENPSENNEPTTDENPSENNEPTTDENPSENKVPTIDEDSAGDKAPTNGNQAAADKNSTADSSSNPDNTIEEKKEALRQAVKKAKAELTDLNNQLTDLNRNLVSQPDYSAEELEYDTWQQQKSSLEDAVQAAKRALEDASFQREQTLRQKAREIANAEVVSPADSTASLYELEIAQLQEDIAKLQAIQKNNGLIIAEGSGFITKVQVAVGSRTMDTAAILLTDASAPCQFKCSITKEQGKYLNLGDTVELKVNGTSTTGSAKLEATVDYLTEGAGGYDIICRLPQNTGQPGAGGSIHKAVQGELHNTVIPIEALYQESEAYYIYTLNEKTGILGKENYVEKIKVRVADKNDIYAALEAGIIGSDVQIVTFCSGTLKQGASVRLVE